ncbi:MAG TPA: hypothetical protein VNA22_02450 [Pyrinomonadaceae bacterium]|nr:hypothetical protein [Pyrinomonadaceae bacterium]
MQNPSIVRTRSRAATAAPARELSWSFILLVLVCACVVATGFFFAARQHFTSMDYGIKNSKLREQLRNLEAEKRRLLLAREVASSPLALRKAARGLGLQQSTTEMASIPVATKKPTARDTAATAVAASAPDKTEHRVVRTVMTAPTEARTSGETRTRMVEAKKEKKDKTEVAALLKFK